MQHLDLGFLMLSGCVWSHKTSPSQPGAKHSLCQAQLLVLSLWAAAPGWPVSLSPPAECHSSPGEAGLQVGHGAAAPITVCYVHGSPAQGSCCQKLPPSSHPHCSACPSPTSPTHKHPQQGIYGALLILLPTKFSSPNYAAALVGGEPCYPPISGY